MRQRPERQKRTTRRTRPEPSRRRTRATAAVCGAALCLVTASASHAAEGASGAKDPTGITNPAGFTAYADRVTSPQLTAATGPLAPAAPTTAAAPTTPATWTSRDATAYWTEERMAAAHPPPDDTAPAEGAAAPTSESAGPAGAAAPVSGTHFDGVPSVGVLFSVGKDARTHHCTAFVVRSPRRDLILTAGHCETGTRAAFVPRYRSGATTQPYGVWAIGKTYVLPGHGTTGAAADLDFAFATVAPDARGRSLEEVTGANVLAPTPGYTTKVTVIGYPSVRHDPQDRAVRCDTVTTRLAGTRQLRMECGGFYGGTSGGPWLTHFDEQSGTGTVVGLIGGLNGGGPSGPESDRVSYSPYFGPEVFDLYARALRD
ncbi:trypsin-like serine peptidase [Streptomyces sp. NPDC048248]|uniref:trypsin-like serine peptidase n=1 Tax=Streptomyces sp. NPDC048248 TaxID=3365523 RepID=UPI0037204321